MTSTFDPDKFPPSEEDGPDPFDFSSLTPANREDIVLLSADQNLPGALPVTANDFELSALGTTADLLGQWNYTGTKAKGDPPISLVSWRHIATTGRDVYVKVVTKGYLFPLGHEVVLTTVVERVVVQDPTSNAWADAYLQVQRYLRVLQPVKAYPATGVPFGGHDWPFSSVRILTTVSPLLDPPNSTTNPTYNPPLVPGKPPKSQTFQQAFFPTSDGQPLQWNLVATDLNGNELHFQAQLVFFEADDQGYVSEFDHTKTATFVKHYNAIAAGDRRFDTHGAPFFAAPEAGGPAGATTHPLVSFVLGAASPALDPNVPASDYPSSPASASSLQSAGQPAFYPVVSLAQIRLTGADALSQSGFSDSGGNGVQVEYYPPFVVNGLPHGTNPGAVYAQLKDAVSATGAPLLAFPSNTVGGIAGPNGFITGLSSVTGPIAGDPTSAATAKSGLDGYASNAKIEPKEFFKTLSNQAASSLSQLLGGLHLADILDEFVDLPGGVPNLTAQRDPTTGVLTVTYTLTASLQSTPASSPVFAPQNPGQLKLVAVATVTETGTTYTVNGSIDPFYIYLLGEDSAGYIIQIPFNSMTFSSSNGQKPTVQVSIGSVSFEGALSFVNALQEFLSSLGGGGLSISVTPTEVDASFSLSLPAVGCGVFTLSGISFSAGVEIPFLGGQALATFGFASQDNPFTLTVCMFGGGGFLMLGLGFGGIQQIQAQFQFEGQFELDIGVASGGITLAAGIYYSYDASPAPGLTTLTGFVRLTGEVSVLGLISISAELDLSLTYQSIGGTVAGTATLSVSISICFFSITVGVTVHKQFAGGGATEALRSADRLRPLASGPSGSGVAQIYFSDIVPDQGTWNTYISAFGSAPVDAP
jgi:hypothetical protein